MALSKLDCLRNGLFSCKDSETSRGRFPSRLAALYSSGVMDLVAEIWENMKYLSRNYHEFIRNNSGICEPGGEFEAVTVPNDLVGVTHTFRDSCTVIAILGDVCVQWG